MFFARGYAFYRVRDWDGLQIDLRAVNSISIPGMLTGQ